MDTAQPHSRQSAQSDVYEQLELYPWAEDLTFQAGLSSILASNQSPEQTDDLTLRAKCFYFSRKQGIAVDFNDYKSWRRQNHHDSSESISEAQSYPNGKHQETQSVCNVPEAEAEPPGLSYQEVVELIQAGKPIPGIKQIPDTVLDGQGTQSIQPRRKKPWEKEAVENEPLEILLEKASE